MKPKKRLVRVIYNGLSVDLKYDNNGNLIEELYSNGQSILYSYDENNRLLEVNHLNQVLDKYEYDENGRVSCINHFSIDEDTDKPWKSIFTYDENGNCIREDVDGFITDYEYDSKGNMTRVYNKYYDSTTSYKYSESGLLMKKVLSSGHSETYEYDEDGYRIFTYTNNKGSSSSVLKASYEYETIE